MSSMKTILFVCLLVAAVAVPMAQALTIIDPIPTPFPPIPFPTPFPIPFPFPFPGSLPSLIRVAGTVFCTATGNANTGILGSRLARRFPGANVALVCGNTIVSTITTNLLGQFSFLLDPFFFNVTAIYIEANCRVVVNTPLSTCNVSLPSTGTLKSPLRLVRIDTLERFPPTVNFMPTGFVFVP